MPSWDYQCPECRTVVTRTFRNWKERDKTEPVLCDSDFHPEGKREMDRQMPNVAFAIPEGRLLAKHNIGGIEVTTNVPDRDLPDQDFFETAKAHSR